MRRPSRFEDIGKTVLIFGLIGPPIGGLAAVFLATGTAGISAIPVAMALSYIFGFVPALLTGLVAGIARQELATTVFVVLVVASGATFSLLFTVLTGDLQGAPLFIEPETLKLTALPGAISALVLAFFNRRKG